MKYKSEIYEVLHQDAIADFKSGAISETELREFEEMCFVQEGEPTYEKSAEPIAQVMEHVTA
jgi:DNA-binding transcriptional regulator YiaG